MKSNRSFLKWLLIVSISILRNYCHADQLGSWSTVFSNSPVQITSMAYGNGTFVGIGSGMRFVSHDGSNWTASVSSPTIDSGGVAYGNGMFLMFGVNNESKVSYVLQSTNGGVTWATIYTPSNPLFSAAFGNNAWVLIGSNEIATATITSTNWSWSEFQPSFSPASVAFINGSFLISAILNYEYSIFSSSDGITWQFNSNLPSLSINATASTGIAYGSGVYVTTAGFNLNGSTHSYIFVSSNLLQWTAVVTNLSTWQREPVALGGNQFLASLDTSTFVSSNGYAWTSHFSGQPPYEFNAISFGQGAFVACNSSGIFKSAVFAAVSNAPPAALSIATYPGVTINGTVGATYQIQSSTNLNSTWQPLTNLCLPYSPFIWVDSSLPMNSQKFYQSVQLQ